MLKRQMQLLAMLLFCGLMQTDYVWDIWDFGFFLAGFLMLGLVLFGKLSRDEPVA